MTARTLRVEQVRTEEQADHVRALARSFVDWLFERYPERKEHIRNYLIAQRFEDELDDLLTRFTPPSGECLLAWVDESPAGIVMLKPQGDHVAEMTGCMFHRKRVEQVLGDHFAYS